VLRQKAATVLARQMSVSFASVQTKARVVDDRRAAGPNPAPGAGSSTDVPARLPGRLPELPDTEENYLRLLSYLMECDRNEFPKLAAEFLEDRELRPVPGHGYGTVARFLDAVDTQEVALHLLQRLVGSKTACTTAGAVYMTTFTYDRGDITEALCVLAREIPVIVGMDWESSTVVGRGCAEQHACAMKMMARGVIVRAVKGTGTAVHYAAVGRTANFPGIQHSKVLMIGSMLIHGSTNWSTSSRGNHEVSTLTLLTKKGTEVISDVLRDILDRGEPYLEAVRQSEHRAAAREASGMRTPIRRARSMSPTSRA